MDPSAPDRSRTAASRDAPLEEDASARVELNPRTAVSSGRDVAAPGVADSPHGGVSVGSANDREYRSPEVVCLGKVVPLTEGADTLVAELPGDPSGGYYKPYAVPETETER